MWSGHRMDQTKCSIQVGRARIGGNTIPKVWWYHLSCCCTKMKQIVGVNSSVEAAHKLRYFHFCTRYGLLFQGVHPITRPSIFPSHTWRIPLSFSRDSGIFINGDSDWARPLIWLANEPIGTTNMRSRRPLVPMKFIEWTAAPGVGGVWRSIRSQPIRFGFWI